MSGQYQNRLSGFITYLLFCMFTGLFLGLFTWNAHQRAWELAESRLEFSSALIAEWIDSAFLASDYLLRDMASQIEPDQLRYPHPDPTAHAELSARLDQRRKTFPYAFLFGAFDRNCIVTHGNAVLGFDASDREYCQQLRDEPYRDSVVTHGYRSNVGPVNVTHARALRGSDGEFLGLVAIALDTEFFGQWLSRMGTGQVDSLAIVDYQQMLLARYPPIPSAVGRVGNEALVADFIDSADTSRVVSVISPLDQQRRLYAARKIDGLPFGIVVGIDQASWMSDWSSLAWLASLGLLVSWLVGFIALRNYQSLVQSRARMRELAQTDFLTGIPNRAYFTALAERELARAKRTDTPVSLVLFDIDRFKAINDAHGHAVGDRAIQAFAAACQSATRAEDPIGRWGGDEFVVLINENLEDARRLADRLRDALDASSFVTERGETITLAASFGLASTDPESQKTLDELIREADLAMFRAKRSGRNRIRRFVGEHDPAAAAKEGL